MQAHTPTYLQPEDLLPKRSYMALLGCQRAGSAQRQVGRPLAQKQCGRITKRHTAMVDQCELRFGALGVGYGPQRQRSGLQAEPACQVA